MSEERKEERLPIPVPDEAMRVRVEEGRRRAEAFVRATQGRGKPMSYGHGRPPEKPKQS